MRLSPGTNEQTFSAAPQPTTTSTRHPEDDDPEGYRTRTKQQTRNVQQVNALTSSFRSLRCVLLILTDSSRPLVSCKNQEIALNCTHTLSWPHQHSARAVSLAHRKLLGNFSLYADPQESLGVSRTIRIRTFITNSTIQVHGVDRKSKLPV
jgi:hypothetical protein